MRPPIADPFGTPPNAQEARVFRLDFWRSLAVYFCVFAAVLTPILWSILAPALTRPTSLEPLLVSIGGVVLGVLLSATINVFYTVEVSRETLQGFNFWWSSKRKVNWNEITRARFFWFGFPYVLISTAKQHDFVWLPLVLSNRKGFAQTVEEWAPEGNPLRLWLQKRDF